MTYTHRHITKWKNKNAEAISYSNLSSNDEATIIRWLHQQGAVFKHCSGMECHDIGDTDYFCGNVATNDIDAILAFMDKLYGEWTVCATYEDIDITLRKMYPDIMHHFSISFSADQKEMLLILFDKFEQAFCYPDIKETEAYR